MSRVTTLQVLLSGHKTRLILCDPHSKNGRNHATPCAAVRVFPVPRGELSAENKTQPLGVANGIRKLFGCPHSPSFGPERQQEGTEQAFLLKQLSRDPRCVGKLHLPSLGGGDRVPGAAV